MPWLPIVDHVKTGAEAIEQGRHNERMRYLRSRVKPQRVAFAPAVEPPPPYVPDVVERTAAYAVARVCMFYDVLRDDVLSDMKATPHSNTYGSTVTAARHAAIYLARKAPGATQTTLGKYFKRTPSVILKSLKVTRELLRTDPNHKISRGVRFIEGGA